MCKNGDYPRLLSIDRQLVLCTIYRKLCTGCGTGFSLLPDDVVPLHSYGADILAARLVASLLGQSLRSRDFYETHGLLPLDAPADQSWTDWLDSNPITPSGQTFLAWGVKFGRSAASWLRLLIWSCIYVGASLEERLGAILAGFSQCPSTLNPLGLSGGALSLLLGKPVEVCIRERLPLLACRPPSHKLLRASGRPPPLYGGSLVCTFLQDSLQNGDPHEQRAI